MMQDVAAWRELINEYGRMRRMEGYTPQNRGQKLNSVIAQTFQCWGMDAASSLRATGETDVVFSLADRRYILEAKWEKEKIDTGPIAKLQKRVKQGIAGTHGVFLSMSGYSEEALQDVSHGERNEILLLDADHWEAMLGGLVPPDELFDLAQNHAAFRGKAYCSLLELFQRGTVSRNSASIDIPGSLPKDLIRSAIPGFQADVVATGIRSNQIGVAVKKPNSLLVTTQSGILEINLVSGKSRIAVPVPDCHRNSLVLADGSILFARRHGVGRYHKKSLATVAGGAIGNSCLMLKPDQTTWLFDNGSPYGPVSASAIKFDNNLGDQTIQPIDYPPASAMTSVWLDDDSLLTVGNPSFAVTSMTTGEVVRTESSQVNPMGLVVLTAGVVMSAGNSVSVGLTDTSNWNYCEVAQFNLSPSVNELALSEDGSVYIASSYPDTATGISYAIAKLALPQRFEDALRSGSSKDVVAELRQWQVTEPLQRRATNLPELQAQITALTAQKVADVEQEMKFRREVSRAFDQLKEALSEAVHAFAQHIPNFGSEYHENIPDALIELGRDRQPFLSLAWGARFTPPGGWPGPQVTMAVGMRVMNVYGNAEIVGLFRVDYVHDNRADPNTVWQGVYTVPVASDQEAHAVSAIKNGFFDGFEEALRLIVDFLQ